MTKRETQAREYAAESAGERPAPTLTDEEREAIAFGIACVTTDKHAAALRKLLERLK